jgi:hypothetical protein
MPATRLTSGSKEMQEVSADHADLIDDLGTMLADETQADETTLTITDGTISVKSGGIAATQLATNAVTAVKITAQNVTGPKIATGALQQLVGAGIDGDPTGGATTLTGAAVGDRVVSVIAYTAGVPSDVTAEFEAAVTVVNQLQQLDGEDLAAIPLVVTLLKA